MTHQLMQKKIKELVDVLTSFLPCQVPTDVAAKRPPPPLAFVPPPLPPPSQLLLPVHQIAKTKTGKTKEQASLLEELTKMFKAK